jgi:3-keto-5-aminohexanoate cleavage enzyme
VNEVADLIVNFTPTGMIPQKSLAPAVPISPQEIIEDVDRAVAVGITMVHLHAREADGSPSNRREVYAEIIGGVRARHPELVVGVSLSGRVVTDFASRSGPLELEDALKPDLASLTLSSMNFPAQASLNAPPMIRDLATMMRERGILPELEVFDLGMINYFRYLETRGVLEPPHYANIILGNISSAQPDLLHAGLLVRDLPAHTLWSFGGIGSAQLRANGLAIVAGGGIRVGLEDNVFWDVARSRTATNAELLTRVIDLAAAFGRRVMSSAELRRRLGLRGGHGCYGRDPGRTGAR